jgi:putative redox protein
MEMEVCFPGGKRVDSSYKGFTVKTDQPKNEGGANTAPEPFDLFLASIGTCAGIYALSFCQARNIDTEKLKMVLQFDKNAETHMVEKISIMMILPLSSPKSINRLLFALLTCAV